MKKQQVAGPNLDRLRTLFESTGHLGPWTQEEYFAVFPPVPVDVPDNPPPQAVVDAENAETEARAVFDAADIEWQQAAADAARRGPALYSTDGVPLTASQKVRGKQRRLDRARDGLWSIREAAAVLLRDARVAYQSAVRSWLLQQHIDRDAAKEQPGPKVEYEKAVKAHLEQQARENGHH